MQLLSSSEDEKITGLTGTHIELFTVVYRRHFWPERTATLSNASMCDHDIRVTIPTDRMRQSNPCPETITQNT